MLKSNCVGPYPDGGCNRVPCDGVCGSPSNHERAKHKADPKRFPEAEALFKRVLAIKPDFVPANRSLGQLYALQGRREDAKTAYQKALELEPRDAKTALALGTLCEETNEFERSIETINSIPARLRPPASLPVLASDYFALKQPDKVAALTPLLRRGAASDPSVVPRFARVLVDNGFVDDAQELLQAAAPHEKLTTEYLMALARVQEAQGNLVLAGRTLARVTKLDPHSFDALFQSARLASQAKEYKKEAALLDKPLEIQPDDLEALRHLVLALMRSGDAVKAVAAARQLYSLKPADPDTLYLLGAALANHAEWHEARPIMEKLVSARDDATAHVMLGMTLMNDGDIEGASQQIERALQQNANEIEAHYYKGGDLERARQAFEQAVSISPEIPENHYQLALAYRRLGFPDKARVQMAEFQKLKNAADHAKANGAASSDPPAENKPPSAPL